MMTTIKQRIGNKILLTLPIPSFKSFCTINHPTAQIASTDRKTHGTIVKMPERESDACNTLFEKNKSGFEPHALVKLKITYIKSQPTTQT